ncbi:class I mannose-6-phosphate isomerase [Streptacidiphilus sp. N1-3]|uniref:Class I mannose-6-phosphate isomerase n=1 Tax=Streptacidiphilus alkalitolerans TaxID=3342712 RepID=A0ABV6WZR4_9ACTN
MIPSDPDRGDAAVRDSHVYDADPCYLPVGGSTGSGWAAAVATLRPDCAVLAVDGPAIAGWDRIRAGLSEALTALGRPVALLDLRTRFAPWDEILASGGGDALAKDPDFAALETRSLVDFFDEFPRPQRTAGSVLIVFGPGAALVEHDLLWYADLPKRYAEAAIADGVGLNLAQPPDRGPGTTRRLFYIDWPVLDRHRDTIADDIALWVDTQALEDPQWLSGDTLRSTLSALSRRPFRTRPTFNSTPWGGHWGQDTLGYGRERPNTALGYELIAPESGVLIGEQDADGARAVEIPFQLLVAQHPEQVLGGQVHAAFGTSFPIRFDYLDTLGGGALSVHCHPQADYMKDVFGWPYTQHETYYVMVSQPGRHIYLGLKGDADVEKFHHDAHSAHHQGRPFAMDDHVQSFPADPHQLFLIPAGTPHGSGEGNVVLEVSATPYLYSLRFYDWLRRGRDGSQRPVHVEHAFNNLDTNRTGEHVARDLVQQPRTLRQGPGWHEEVIGSLPEMFFDVRRIVLESEEEVGDDTEGRFHVINVVEGGGVLVRTADGHSHALAYAETLTIPAAVGAYTLRRLGSAPVRIVKALVQ